jgi:3-isopropylmalate/(R)-2-methylmalate dehydratase small subunit
MMKFTALTSRIVALPLDDIDTDQIIPARFLTATGKTGLGAQLFAGWRYSSTGAPNPDFILNRPETAGAQILLAGNNFGCGSSREHAPWALLDFGFRAVFAASFADIFMNNAHKNGLLPVILTPAFHRGLLARLNEDSRLAATVDLSAQRVSLPDGASTEFPIELFTRDCLMEGVDELDYIRKFEPEIARFESRAGTRP